jgi:hypothetical protein
VSRYFPDQKKDRLEEVYIGGAASRIGNHAFRGSGVENVTIGQSVTSIVEEHSIPEPGIGHYS